MAETSPSPTQASRSPAGRVFQDRRDAGRVLAGLLEGYRRRPDVVVLGLPRGGVPVAYEVARALGAPLDVFVVRKLGVPGHEELAMGAIASGGVVVLNDDVVRGLGIAPEVIQRVTEREGRELLRREQAYREGRPMPNLAGKTVILVDDGLATGSSMRAAVQALRTLGPARIVVAVPAAPESTCQELAAEVDEVVCATTPSPFLAVGYSYWDFAQTTDALRLHPRHRMRRHLIPAHPVRSSAPELRTYRSRSNTSAIAQHLLILGHNHAPLLSPHPVSRQESGWRRPGTHRRSSRNSWCPLGCQGRLLACGKTR